MPNTRLWGEHKNDQAPHVTCNIQKCNILKQPVIPDPQNQEEEKTLTTWRESEPPEENHI